MSSVKFEPAEARRLIEDAKRTQNWKRWGPYLSARQWGTVREDYSADGNVWAYFTHEQSRSRAYRWGEDGLLGICDRECRLCFSVALWNENDPILKERLFGLSGIEGNHGEDVKEEYFYLDSTPTHSYMKALYKYPHAKFPYEQLLQENRKRTRKDAEFELVDTGIFKDNRYFDVLVEYAKNSPDDLLIKITITNRGPETARLHVLPTLWFRNTWAWGCKHEGCDVKPRMSLDGTKVVADHVTLGRFHFFADDFDGQQPEMLFTENETNLRRVFHAENYYAHVKDAFHDYVVGGKTEAVSASNLGTKVAARYGMEIPPGESVTLRQRLCSEDEAPRDGFDGFDQVMRNRKREADEFYVTRIPETLSDEQKLVSRQAYAGLLWNKQFYHYIVRDWLEGDPEQPPPPPERWQGRNSDWLNLYNRDVLSMPDNWEFPWYASWDLAFHLVTFAHIDPQFAKDQCILLLREWYMHPNGQIPATEYDFSMVNPPVHAWACWRIYKMTGEKGQRDREFLERSFHKLLLNFTWWVNRKDVEGRNIFSGGFLGLDNIGLFDRSEALPNGARLDQADGTAWMAFYCGTMLSIALELAEQDIVYEDVASKFFEHFIGIVDAINTLGGTGLWDEEDGFYYDHMLADGKDVTLRVRSMVGLIPLIACEILENETIAKLPGFTKRMNWFLVNRKDLARHITYCDLGQRGHRLLAVPSRDKLERVLKVMLDENEFLSPHGVRSLSKLHQARPFEIHLDGKKLEVHYAPGESDVDIFGGNSNWRGPVWFPLNYLIIEALERYHHFYGDTFAIEFPTGSGQRMNLQQIARALSQRMTTLFLPGESGQRPCFGPDRRFADDPACQKLLWFHEYFHGDSGKGLGASHQTGWTALVARLLENLATSDAKRKVLLHAERTADQSPQPAGSL